MKKKIGGKNNIILIDECFLKKRKYNVCRCAKKIIMVGCICLNINVIFYTEKLTRWMKSFDQIILESLQTKSMIIRTSE